MSEFGGVLLLGIFGLAIYAVLHWSGFFDDTYSEGDRNPYGTKKINIKRGVVSRGESNDSDAENFDLAKDDEIKGGPSMKYPTKFREPFTSENNK